MRRNVTILLFFILVFLVSCIRLNVVSSDHWIPFTPDSDQTQLTFWMENETAFMNVTIYFEQMCYRIDSWGTLVVDCNDFSVDSEIWEWIGYCASVEWSAEYTYDLGQLDEGVYSFSFCCWRNPVKSVVFEVGSPADINDDGKIDMEDVGSVARLFGVHASDPTYDPDCDLNNDGKIDMKDVGSVAKHYGEGI